MNTLLIYGATGYTGRMVATHARAVGLDICLAGRDEARLSSLAAELGVPYRVIALDDDLADAGASASPEGNERLKQAISGFHTVLNCAGPFARTAGPLMRACMAAGAHYLDITAEIRTYQHAESLGSLAADAGVMLMPGVGWDVVPTDSLAMQVAQSVNVPVDLRIALKVAGGMSRGSAASAGEIVAAGLLVRRDGELVSQPDASTVRFDFGDGPVECFPLSFGDLVTAWHSTGIRNISMFVHVTGDAFPTGDLASLPEGPTQAQRDADRAAAVVEVTGADGVVSRAVIDTINGYSYTPLAAVAAARRVMEGEWRPGFETPARVFGAGFAESIGDSTVTHLA